MIWILAFLPLFIFSLYQVYLEVKILEYKKERKNVDKMLLDLKNKIEGLK